MLLFNHISIIIVICNLFRYSLGNVVRQGEEVEVPTGRSLNGTLKSRGTNISSQDLEVHPNTHLSHYVDSRSAQISARDADIQSDPYTSLGEDSASPQISPRDLAPGLTGMDLLLANNQLCAHRRDWPPSPGTSRRDLQKRKKPSAVLWQGAAERIFVDMGLAAWHAWSEAPQAIGTYGLCGCTAVAIVTQTGALVAHISPNEAQFLTQMNNIRNIYNRNLGGQILPRVFVFVPALDNVIQSQFWQNWIVDFLTSQLGVSVQTEPYRMVLNGGAHDGTLLVRRVARAIQVFVNDILISSSS